MKVKKDKGKINSKEQREKGRSIREDWKLIVRGYKVLYDVCPQKIVWNTLGCITQRIIPFFTLCLSAEIITQLTKGASYKHILVLAVITVAGQLVFNLWVHFCNKKREETESINFDLNELYMLKTQCRMQYKYMEDLEIMQLRRNIRNFSNYGEYGLGKLYWCYSTFLGAIINLVCSITLTFSLFRRVPNENLKGFLAFVNHPCSIFILLVIIGINIVAKMLSIYHYEPKNAEIWSNISNRLSYANRYLQFETDTTIMGAVDFSLSRCQELILDDKNLRESFHIKNKESMINRFLEMMTNIALYLYVGAKAFIGTFGIGSFILYTGTVDKFVTAVSELGGVISNLRQNNKYLIELFRFLDLPDEMYHGSLSVEKREDNKFDIEFRNVSFKYPGSDTYALKNVSFKFNMGERLAFVGMNGSGKTTFVKLLCRLYDPTEGQILLKGIDISKYDYEQYINLFSVVFQDIFLFAFSLGENISAQLDYDPEKVKNCLEKVNFGEKLSNLEKGLNTAFGFMYEDDGVEFSGGEEQKIVLARALYKNAPYIILDEPTASLDPISEAEVYANFNNIMDGKTAIYISHRLSSCRFADKILVFHEGNIIQQGSHEELVADISGKYFELWNAQAKYYMDRSIRSI